MARKRSGLSRASLVLVHSISNVLDELRGYWPLTLRQVYYQLVAREVIPNNIKEYKKLSSILTRARLQGLVPWEAIEDRSRSLLTSGGYGDMDHFVESETESFLDGYRRDLLQSQDFHLELWVEKDALSRICHRAAMPYCVSVIVAKGYSSISFVHECRKRIERYLDHDKGTIIIYFGDLDPSGWNMLPTMLDTLQNEMNLFDAVEGVRCALTEQQVYDLKLPHNPDALKVTDPRAKSYVAQFGELAVELDAIPPDTLVEIIQKSIEDQLDMTLFNGEKKTEEKETKALVNLKDTVDETVETYLEQQE